MYQARWGVRELELALFKVQAASSRKVQAVSLRNLSRLLPVCGGCCQLCLNILEFVSTQPSTPHVMFMIQDTDLTFESQVASRGSEQGCASLGIDVSILRSCALSETSKSLTLSSHMADSFYAVLGGDTPEVVGRPPFLARSRTSPIMPIIIKCTSKAEANSALDLHKIFKKNNHTQADQQPEVFAKALAESLQISDLFATTGSFYAIYNGKSERVIIVRNYADVVAQVHGYQFAKFRKFETIKDAIIYMVLKGDLEKMRTLGLLDTKSGTDNKTTTKIFSHIRDFTGIIDTIYGITEDAPAYPSQRIGRHAGYYLHSHGYTSDTIEDITKIWANSPDVEEFVGALGDRGMPATEVRWLWDLIRHDDDCGS
ncbi:hypothetical protein C8J57DRAFT_1257187 [Mycena rebaudengoi]|nr:hypothetical protein C8J57DRAFT_1257187 [Mycena rebaudengoi]